MLTRRAFTLIASAIPYGRSIAGSPMTWPQDADGDVFRQLQKSGFDFTKLYVVDFNVDFAKWPRPKRL